MHLYRSGLAIALIFLSLSAFAESAIQLKTRPDVVQKALVIQPEKPVAAVILFAGGHGNLMLDGTSIGWGRNNFLVRTRDQFADRGFLVVTMDAPSDHAGKQGMLGGFRASAEHATDIDAVIAYVRKQADVAVWLVGTSRGTESATNVAIRATQPVAGLVLTSSMTESNSGGPVVTEMALDRIRVPVLIAAHKDDGCHHTPPSGVAQIQSGLKASPRVEVKIFQGGDKPESKPCEARSQHGFLGIEREVIEAIATFIKSGAR